MFHKISVAALALVLCGPVSVFAQEVVTESAPKKVETTQDKSVDEPKEIVGYGFTIEKSVDCTPVKSQDRTGTCWSQLFLVPIRNHGNPRHINRNHWSIGHAEHQLTGAENESTSPAFRRQLFSSPERENLVGVGAV